MRGIMPISVNGDDEIDANVEISASADDILKELKTKLFLYSNPNFELFLIQLVLEYLWLVVSNAGSYLLKQLCLGEVFLLINFQIRLYVQMFV